MTAREGTDRLRVLVETGIAINSELSLDGVLERIVEAAARVTDAHYAALGVIDRAGTGLERFVTYGMTEEVASALSSLAGLRVIDRSSVTPFAGGKKSSREIGAALHADALLTGDSLFVGGGPSLTLSFADAVFTPLVARQVTIASRAGLQRISNDTLLAVASGIEEALEVRSV